MSPLPVLLLWVDPTETELHEWYTKRVIEHNKQIYNNPFPNSGFDILTNVSHSIKPNGVYKIDYKVKAVMGEGNDEATGFLFVPRSSIAKTPLMLANHVGIIDSGYRGNLIGAFRNLEQEIYVVEKLHSLMQICHPTLKPFVVHMVDEEKQLGETIRGNCGFGSTGL